MWLTAFSECICSPNRAPPLKIGCDWLGLLPCWAALQLLRHAQVLNLGPVSAELPSRVKAAQGCSADCRYGPTDALHSVSLLGRRLCLVLCLAHALLILISFVAHSGVV